MRIPPTIRVFAAAVPLTLAATACGSSSAPPSAPVAAVSYAPAAYGVPAVGAQPGQCYWIDYPQEAAALIAAGLCQPGWIPTQAPMTWQEEYYDYYASPAYYSTYVPATYRTVYVSRQTTFYTTYRTKIVIAEKSAVYKGSNGSTLKGTTSTLKFTSGNGSVTRNGGGSARGGTSVRPCSLGSVVLADRTGAPGGGSARGGTSVSTTRSTAAPAATKPAAKSTGSC